MFGLEVQKVKRKKKQKKLTRKRNKMDEGDEGGLIALVFFVFIGCMVGFIMEGYKIMDWYWFLIIPLVITEAIMIIFKVRFSHTKDKIGDIFVTKLGLFGIGIGGELVLFGALIPLVTTIIKHIEEVSKFMGWVIVGIVGLVLFVTIGYGWVYLNSLLYEDKPKRRGK